MLSIILLLACGGDKTDDTGGADDSSATDDSGATDDSSATDDSGADDSSDGSACDPMNSGDDWYWTGECPQMRTPCDIVVDGCSLSIDYSADGGMTMGMPYTGTIEGSTVTFTDGDSVTGCVGTLEDADTLSGTCVLEGEACTFTLRR